MTLRVTHLYRRTGGAWQLLHRHADLPRPTRARPPPDRRPARELAMTGRPVVPGTRRPAARPTVTKPDRGKPMSSDAIDHAARRADTARGPGGAEPTKPPGEARVGTPAYQVPGCLLRLR
jgi:hypothetical protein